MPEMVPVEQLPDAVARRVGGLVDVLVRTFPADKVLSVADTVARQVVTGVRGVVGDVAKHGTSVVGDVASVADKIAHETTAGVKESAKGVVDEIKKGPPLPRIGRR